MKVVVTGAAGFLGARLAAALLAPDCELRGVSELVLVDARQPAPPAAAAAPAVRVRALAVDLAANDAAERVVEPDTAVVFHLAAIVSGHAEKDFDLGLRVNLDATRALLEAARHRAPGLVFVLASTVGVLGGELPPLVDEGAAPTPQSSYGCAKAMSELLASEYGRRGFTDARVLRLPTVSVRGGGANQAVTSYASGVVREPLSGLEAAVPVPRDQELWLAGPAGVVRNLVHAAALPARAWVPRRVLALPGLTVSAGEMVAALERVAGAAVAARVRWAPEPALAAMVATFPARLDARRALALGFEQDASFDDLIREYIRDDLGGRLPEKR
ncbi:D-erythronate dehydrogenase-like [Choristoneura fumiferana]|uniref:D-erythronate dehydrogenase-like n=1 Tax=Choristoneura fumiferana TaxID=7141 RepID=UPI003D154B03